MTNREKYAEQILDVACSGNSLAMDKEKNITSCENIDCNECGFFGNDTTWCGENIKKWANSEYIEKPKISKSDREFLDYLSDDFKYIARDEDGSIAASKGEIYKGDSEWRSIPYIVLWGFFYFASLKGFKVSFPMVKWEDEKPWLIEDLKKLEVE